MNRKLGQLIKAALFALPFALPGVALAQSATGSTGSVSGSSTDTANPSQQGTSDKGTLDQDQNKQGSSGMSSGSSGGTLDQTDKQNAGSPGSSTAAPSDTSQGASGMGTGSQGTSGTGSSDYNPPAGSLDKSGSSSTSDRNLGGDLNKSDDTSNLNKESTDTGTKPKKKMHKTTKKSSSETTIDNEMPSDSNK